jgi:hypothetical protein
VLVSVVNLRRFAARDDLSASSVTNSAFAIAKEEVDPFARDSRMPSSTFDRLWAIRDDEEQAERKMEMEAKHRKRRVTGTRRADSGGLMDKGTFYQSLHAHAD